MTIFALIIGGGCAIASPFDTPSTLGVDCSAIPNVATVSCQSSKCLVEQCVEGFSVSSTNDSCVPISARDLVGVDAVEGATANVAGILGISEGALASAHVGRDLVGADVVEGLEADVGGLVGVSEAGAASVHVARDLLDAVVGEAAGLDVGGLVGLTEGAAAGVSVA